MYACGDLLHHGSSLFIVISADSERSDLLSSLHAILGGDVYMHATKVSHYFICDRLICATKLAGRER